jgi:putative hemolysin
VEDLQDETVVGTYRLQTGTRAQFGLGFYSAQAFDFTPYASRRHELLELGRACIHADHRHFAVLNLLWSGIARYAQQREVRYLIGCSSLNSTEAADAAAVMLQLAKHRAEPAWWTRPLPRYALALDAVQPSRMRVPRLLAAYLAMGARICAEPALDAEFGSIDFLTWIDLQSPALQALRERGRFGA